MLYRLILFLSMPLVLAGCGSLAGREAGPEAREGVIDLRGINLAGDRIIRLDGQWRFCYNRLLGPLDPDTACGTVFIDVPGDWKGFSWQGTALPGTGCCTYSLVAITGKPRVALSLYVPVIGTSYRLFLDGEPVAQAGHVSADRMTAIPEATTNRIVFTPAGDTTRILMQVSNFHYRVGGIWDSLEIGSAGAIANAREQSQILSFIMVGACLFLFIYFFTFFLFRQEERAALLFSLILLVSGIRITLTGDLIIYKIVPGLGWETLNRLDILSFYFLVLLFILYMRSLYPDDLPRPAYLGGIPLFAAFIIATMFTRAMFFSSLLPYAEMVSLLLMLLFLWTIILAVIRKREYAVIFLAGYLFVFVSAVSELFSYFYLSEPLIPFPVGIVLLFLSQTVLFSRKFSREFQLVETLSQRLLHANREIEKANVTIASLDRVKGEFLRLISKDIRKPLDRIISYTGLLKSRLRSDDLEEILNHLDLSARRLEKFSKLGTIISDLQQNQGLVQKNNFHAGDLIRSVVANAEEEARAKEIRLITEIPPGDWVITGDPALLAIGFGNIVGNSIKYSHKGGVVRISLTSASDWFIFECNDQGIGFSEKALENLFKLFALGEKHTDKHIGLDLALVKLIADAHQGRVEAGNNQGSAGAYVRIYLKRLNADE